MSSTFMTPNGKEIKIYQVKNTALYKPAFSSGGELPKELDQMFTSPQKAGEQIQKYLNSKEKGTVKTNAKTAE